jgi:hypothetical protein
MSKIALTPDASGTGTFTIAAPNSNTDRTLTLPDATGTVLAAPAGAVTINSSAPSNSLTVDGSGNAGFGTASPGSRVEIFSPSSALTTGNLALNTSSTTGASRISFKESGSTVGQIAYSHDGNNLELIANESGSGILFYTNGTNERARITSAGTFSVGNTAVTPAFSGTGATSTIPVNSGSGGALCLVRGYDTNSGIAYCNAYVVAVRVNSGGPPDVAATLLNASGASKTITFSSSGGFVVLTPSAATLMIISFFGL